MRYDAFGRLAFRGRRCSRNIQPGVTERLVDRIFIWDGDHIIAETDSTGTKRFAEYAYLPGMDRPFALVTDSVPGNGSLTRLYHQDELGNIIGLTRGDTIDQQLAYDPWGEITSITGSVADTNRLRWKGMFWEGGNTRMYYVRNRWYDPDARRFTSQDPIGLDGGLNQYAFGGNDPVNTADPTGLEYCFWKLSHVLEGYNLHIEVDEWICDDRDLGTTKNPSGRGSIYRGGREEWSVGPRPSGGSPPDPEEPVYKGLACAVAGANAGLYVVGDIAFLTGVGVGWNMARGLGAGALATVGYALERGGVEMIGARFLYGRPEHATLRQFGRVARGMALNVSVWTANDFVTDTPPTAKSFILNFLPFVNTWKALKSAYHICS